jgi:hypothetical protein
MLSSNTLRPAFPSLGPQVFDLDRIGAMESLYTLKLTGVGDVDQATKVCHRMKECLPPNLKVLQLVVCDTSNGRDSTRDSTHDSTYCDTPTPTPCATHVFQCTAAHLGLAIELL